MRLVRVGFPLTFSLLPSRELKSRAGRKSRMAHNRARIVVGLLTTFLWGFSPAAAEEPARQLRIEKEFPQTADYMCVGFGSLWMMSDRAHPKLLRIALADNAVTEIPVDGRHRRIPPDHTWGGRRLGIGQSQPDHLQDRSEDKSDCYDEFQQTFASAPKQAKSESARERSGRSLVVLTRCCEGIPRKPAWSRRRYHCHLHAAPGVVVDFGSIWVAGSERRRTIPN